MIKKYHKKKSHWAPRSENLESFDTVDGRNPANQYGKIKIYGFGFF